jgi:hypothetical protein
MGKVRSDRLPNGAGRHVLLKFEPFGGPTLTNDQITSVPLDPSERESLSPIMGTGNIPDKIDPVEPPIEPPEPPSVGDDANAECSAPTSDQSKLDLEEQVQALLHRAKQVKANGNKRDWEG